MFIFQLKNFCVEIGYKDDLHFGGFLKKKVSETGKVFLSCSLLKLQFIVFN